MVVKQSWFKMYHSFLEWEWYSNINTKTLFFHCLLKATPFDKKWRGIIIKKGSLLTQIHLLSDQTGLSIQQVKTALTNLLSTNEVTKQSTTKYTIISVTCWDSYQPDNTPNNKRTTNEQQTNNKLLIENKNKNKNKKNKYTGEFEKFWKLYPRYLRDKGDKKEAFDKFQIAIKKTNLEIIFKGVKDYETYIKHVGQKCRDASTWLNKETWKNDHSLKGLEGVATEKFCKSTYQEIRKRQKNNEFVSDDECRYCEEFVAANVKRGISLV